MDASANARHDHGPGFSVSPTVRARDPDELMSNERTISNLTSLADLGAALRQEFHSLIVSSASDCLDARPMSDADSQVIQSLEEDLQDLQHLSDDLLVLEAWLTSGFFPTDLSSPLHREENITSTLNSVAVPAWLSPAAQSVAPRSLHSTPHPEATFTQNEALAERGPTVLLGQERSGLTQSSSAPQQEFGQRPIGDLVAGAQTSAFRALQSDVAFENAPSVPRKFQELTETNTPRRETPEAPPPIRTFSDLASRLRTASVDEHALSAESPEESFVTADPEPSATIAAEAEPLARATVAFPQTNHATQATLTESASPQTGPPSSEPDASIMTSDNLLAQSPPEPIVLGTLRAAKALARLGISTSPDAASTLLAAPQSWSEQLVSSPASFVESRESQSATQQGMASARESRSPRRLQHFPSPPTANAEEVHVHDAQLTSPAPAGSSRLGQPEAPQSSRSVIQSEQSERLHLEDVDTILESLEREIEHEYRRYYRD